MSPLVSIVIPAWNKDANASALCDAAIRSIAREVQAAYELIIVDNDSPVKGFRTSLGAVPDGRVVELQRNVGFGPAVNAGFSRAMAPFLCQMNSDCELVEDSVSLLIETMQKHELSVGMPEHYENCLHYGLGKSDELMGPDWRFGAFWVITRRAWDLVGGFDESFRMCYWEDSDLWKRIEACGGIIAGWRGTWVKHLGGASTHPIGTSISRKTEPGFFRDGERLHLGNLARSPGTPQIKLPSGSRGLSCQTQGSRSHRTCGLVRSLLEKRIATISAAPLSECSIVLIRGNLSLSV